MSQTIGQDVEAYYRLHARIYDATRWTFLFGRGYTVRQLARCCQPAPARILEVGCGTGSNVDALAMAFPQAQITGLDLSGAMLDIARATNARHGSRVNFVQTRYDKPLPSQYDLVLCSYALTMFNPGWEEAIRAAHGQLAPGGRIAVVDFHYSPFGFFRRWMGMNHVRMEKHLLPLLLFVMC